jgi:exodeoxyribonuclease V alpha subunit
VPDLVGPPGSRRPLVLEGAYLYHHKHFVSEQRIAESARARLAAPPIWSEADRREALDRVIGSARPVPTEEQRVAIQGALGRRLAVISGAPGAGKTTIAVTLLRALVRLGVPVEAVAFTAPTGKAANRLETSIAAGLAAVGQGDAIAVEDRALLAAPPGASTLHRLLGYSPSARAFAHHEQSPLPQRVVLVDESSMVDLQLMDRLLRALAPEACLVLLGDADQLPSVEAGAVFRDLAPHGTRLTRSHRQDPTGASGRRILDLAAAVRAGGDGLGAGGAGAAGLAVRAGAGEVRFDGAELVPASEREALLERWYGDRVAASADLPQLRAAVLPLGPAGFSSEVQAQLDALHAHYQRFRLLAVTRGRPTGAMALNDWMHRRAGAQAPAPIPGEPVLMLRNDYDRGLWNGDQGLCVRVREEGRPPRTAAAFKTGERWTAWHLESLRDSLTLAYALTVHKAQGSEHDDVALLLPDVPLPLTTRELLYTALTRARRSVVLCSAQPVLEAALHNTVPRSSGLPGRLSG